MTLGYVAPLRNNMMNQITTLADVGPLNARLRFYDGSRPATGGAATNLLAEVTLSDPSFGASVNGVITAGAIAPDTATAANGVATWIRLVDGNGNTVLDGSVGLPGSGADIILDDTTIRVGQELRIASWSITEGNE